MTAQERITNDPTDSYLVLASPLLTDGSPSGDLHILEHRAVKDETQQDRTALITACYEVSDFRDYLVPAPGKSGERMVRRDWVQVARKQTIPGLSERARDNLPVYVKWARREQWHIWARER